MTELQSGDVVKLVVKEEQESKYVLTNDNVDIPLNISEVTEPLKVNQKIEVFLYADRRGNLAATTALPHILKGEYGWARVLHVKDREGAYVDIGTSREVLVPAEDLPKLKSLWPEPGNHLYVTLRTDREGGLFGRLATEEKILELYEDADPELFNKNILARPYRLLPVGTFLLGVDTPYRIFVHESERGAEPRLGSDISVRVIEVKEDGTINASMLPRVYERLSDDAEQIFKYLEDVGGKMPFGDKSSPEEIKEMFHMSKGAFKRALGTLMKANRITQEDGWTSIK
ncbi:MULTISPECIES: S1 RNA-binding domain-containing protein [unclassified Rummeliibacillus]|uniref:CvfB family protein n=1 Tax=unclassified Rummeliibacillus TaxID=2622809 RepID=UPI000E662212|nr:MULTISPECIES: S1-like domain-containing RNA-binding protein [unclassified Rummeliibacillus]RIJ64386.1 DNA-binding protein [Rummeliibacillus sp. POC4]RPJ96550.1 DNA-binding protein [Rummeliibacillus sp. TYF005]